MAIPFQHIRETRRARGDEARGLAALLAGAPLGDVGAPSSAWSPEALLAWFADENRIAYVAAPVAEQAIGIVLASPTVDWFDLAPFAAPLLWVEPSRRREGWGTKLAGQAIIWARRRGARSVAFRLPPEQAGSAGESFALSRGWRLTAGWAIAELGD